MPAQGILRCGMVQAYPRPPNKHLHQISEGEELAHRVKLAFDPSCKMKLKTTRNRHKHLKAYLDGVHRVNHRANVLRVWVTEVQTCKPRRRTTTK